MNGLARFCWISAVVYVLIGMAFGIYMSVTQQHNLAGAHAHLNLIGWVTMALFGTFYHLRPAAGVSTFAKAQVGLMQIGVILMFPGIILAILGITEALAKAGSLFAIISMAMFLVIVIRHTKPD